MLPETGPNPYKLKKYKTIKYDSLRKCFINEVCKIPGINEQKILEEFDNLSNCSRFEEKKKIIQTHYLLDENNKITHDELLAIFLYSFWDNRNLFDFIGEFQKTLVKGGIGNFNCYFEYLYNRLTKINPKYLKKDQLLYSRVLFDNKSLIQEYENLKVGDELLL